MKNNYLFLISLFFISLSHTSKAQSVISFVPGVYYNGGGFDREIFGGGAILGIEYTPRKQHFFSLELRSRIGGYSFDSEAKWDPDQWITKPEVYAVDYSLFNSQIGIVPTLNLYLSDELWFFLENEFAMGIFTGNFKYLGERPVKKKITNHILSYNLSIGAGWQSETWSLSGSIGYSTLNFRGNIRRHQPAGFEGWIPDQNAILLVDVKFKIPLKGKKK